VTTTDDDQNAARLSTGWFESPAYEAAAEDSPPPAPEEPLEEPSEEPPEPEAEKEPEAEPETAELEAPATDDDQETEEPEAPDEVEPDEPEVEEEPEAEEESEASEKVPDEAPEAPEAPEELPEEVPQEVPDQEPEEAPEEKAPEAPEEPPEPTPEEEAPAPEAEVVPEGAVAVPVVETWRSWGEQALGRLERLRRRVPVPGPRLVRVLAPVLVLVVDVALAMWLYRAVWKSPTTVTIDGGNGDAAIFLWSLGWVAHVAQHGGTMLVSQYLNSPDGVNLMWNTSLPLPGWLLAPVTHRWGEVLTLNLILVLAFALSAWCAYLAIRRYAPNHWAAAFGGLIYAFSPAMRTQTHHPHMTLAFLPPLMLLALDEILVRQRRHPLLIGALLGLMAGVQLWIGEELLASTALFGALLLIVLVLMNPRRVLEARRALYALAAFGVALVVAAAIIAWPVAVQFTGPQRVHGDVQTKDFYDDLKGFVLPGRAERLAWSSAKREAAAFITGDANYLGVPLILGVLVSLAVLWRRPGVRVGFLLMLAAALLSLGSVLHVGGRVTKVGLPWGSLQRLPLLSSLMPSRLGMFTAGFAGLLLAILLTEAWRRGGWLRWVALGVTVLTVLSLFPAYTVPAKPVATPPFFTSAAVRQLPRDSTVLVLPFPYRGMAITMTWQAQSDMWFRMPGGYVIVPSLDGSPRFDVPLTALSVTVGKIANGVPPPVSLNAGQREAMAADLRRWRVSAVVVGPMPNRTATVTFLTGLFHHRPRVVGGVQLWRHPVVDLRPGKL